MSVQKEELTDVSVIIPVYNRGQFLAECIQSVLDQKTDFPVEIVCADDGYNPSVSVAWFFVLKTVSLTQTVIRKDIAADKYKKEDYKLLNLFFQNRANTQYPRRLGH